VQVLAFGSVVGLRVASGLFRHRCRGSGWERATTTTSSVRLAWCSSGRKTSLTWSVVIVAPPIGRRSSPLGAPFHDTRLLQHRSSGVKTLSFVTCDGNAYGVVSFLEVSHLELDSTHGSGIWFLGGVARMRQRLGCARSVLAGRCRGAMVVASLEFVRMVLW
jgi:hypothetical protein